MLAATMQNGMDGPQQHELYGYKTSPHHHRPSAAGYHTLNSTTIDSSSLHSSSSVQKRGRGGTELSSSLSVSSSYCPQQQRSLDSLHQPTVQHYQHDDGGGDDDDDDDDKTPVDVPFKKSRSNNYQAPRSVKPSVLTAMGTLAAVGATTTTKTGAGSFHTAPAVASGTFFPASVPIRRRLSGGHIEEFIGGHDHMDIVDTSDSRPRSMSF
jgi:hypothetical protein